MTPEERRRRQNLESAQRSRARSVEFPGAPLGNARLTADDVREIRALAANGVTRRETARQFSISKSNVTMIVNRHTWRHIQ